MSGTGKFDQLVQRYVDGGASPADVDVLNQRLRDDPEFRQSFIEVLNLDSALSAAFAGWDAGGMGEREENTHSGAAPIAFADQTSSLTDSTSALRSDSPTTSARPGYGVWFAFGAALCLALVLAAWKWLPVQEQGFAHIASAQGVAEFADASALGDEWHEMGAGTVELVTGRGARVVIEAPAKFRFESAQRLRVNYGRVSADVPPAATGFTVVTPTGDAIDLGTRFGVDVPANGDAEIHVFEGEVIARSTSGDEQRNLSGGEAYRLTDKNGTERVFRSSAFIEHAEVASLHAALAAGQQRRSNEAVAALRRDPALIALMDFETDELPKGAYRMVQGRWPGSRAPEFVNEGEHMKLDVGGNGSWPQLTLAAWVRLDRFGQRYHSMLHTDGWDKNNFGQVHWMVTRYKTMRLALFGNTLAPGSVETELFPDSRTSVLTEQGRWMHLAVVYDSAKKTVRFFLNGRFDSETRQEIAYPARLGPAQIGNWDSNDRKLSGRIDELLLLGRAMSDAELLALYEAGNPYRGVEGE